MARLSDRVVTGAPDGILSNDEPIQWYAADGITLIDGIKVDATDAVYLAPAGGLTEVGGDLDVTGNTTTPAIGLGTSTLAHATTTWQQQVQGDTLAFSRYDTTGTSGSNACGIQLRNEGSHVGGIQYAESTGRTLVFGPDGGQNIYMEAGSTTVGTDLTVTGNLDVTGTTTGSGYLYLSSKTANQGLRLNNTTKIQSWNPAGNVLRDLMELDANEDVRIGSSANPIYLDNDTTVTGNIEASERIRLGNNKLLQARNAADTQWRPVLTVDTNNDLVIGSSSTPITLDVNTTVDGDLTVSGYIKPLLTTTIPTWDSNTYVWSESGYGARFDGYQMKFDTGSARTTALTIDISQNVSIPNGDLAVDGDINAVGIIESGTYSNVGATSGCKIFQSGTVTISTTSTSTVNRINFYNPNGQVGRIRTSGTATSYVTSSDPRLKSEFTPITNASEMILEAREQGMIGEFTFLADPTQTIWGYNAHKLIDAQPNFGGSEGEGSRDAPLGDDVTPAGVDQSKRVPLLEAAIGELLDRIKVLEEAGAK